MIYELMSFSAAAQEQKPGVTMLVLSCPCDDIPESAECRVSRLPLSQYYFLGILRSRGLRLDTVLT